MNMATTEVSQIKNLADVDNEDNTSQTLKQVANENTFLLHQQFCRLQVRSAFKRTVCRTSKPVTYYCFGVFLQVFYSG